MYSDRLASGKKRSVKERLNGNFEDNFDSRQSRQSNSKRQRQNDEKWKHDLYEDDEERPDSDPKIGSKDLRAKLQRKVVQRTYQSGKVSVAGGVKDLREKLSGTINARPANTDLPKPKSLSEDAKLAGKNIPVEAPVSVTKRVAKRDPSTKKSESQQKDETSVDGFLQSLSLEKYSITFQAEEIDMTALLHMTAEDLKALGIPMGPRKKILLALDSRT